MPSNDQEYLWLSLRQGKYGGVDVVGFKEMPPDSVLAGQTVTCFLDNFETEEAALAEYPEAAENWTSKALAPQASTAHLPDENDPVSGGMYPDDYDDGY